MRVNSSGFSLLEVLVAVCVISTAFVVILSGFGRNLKLTGTSEDYMIAAMLAKQKMVELEHKRKIKPGTSKGDFGKLYPRFSWETDITFDEKRNFYMVTLTVSVNRTGAKREVILRTILAPQMENFLRKTN